MTVLAFMVIPVRIVWLAVLDGLYVLVLFIASGWRGRLGILVAMGHFFWMLGPAIWRGMVAMKRSPKKGVGSGKGTVVEDSFHRCAHCGRTDSTDPELEFRVSGDGREYCGDHLPQRRVGSGS